MDMEKGSSTQIIVALIGVIGMLGGALFANWDKVFPHKQANVITSISQDAQKKEVVKGSAPLTQSIIAKTEPTVTKEIVEPSFFSGQFTGFSTEGFERNFAQASLSRNGKQVNGSFKINDNIGRINGMVNGNTLHYSWNNAGYSGHGVLVQIGRQITGTWGYGSANSGAGQTQMQQ